MNVAYNVCRCVCTDSTCFNKYFSREGKFMGKIIHGDHGKRKWYKSNESASALPSPFTARKLGPPQNARRMNVLNKLFMKHITDLMATGEVASAILGKGIEVSKVKMSPDFNQVNVFWLARSTEEKDNRVEEILNSSAIALRHELSQLRVMGAVPVIKFVRDKQFAKVMEVDERLAMADFGNDFEPTDPTMRLRTELVLNTRLPPEVRSRIEELESSEEYKAEVYEEPLPVMRGDVLGLNHFGIMSKVKSSMDKSLTAARKRALNIVITENETKKPVSMEVAEYMTSKERKEAFSEFLMKRQIQEKRKKRLGLEKNYLPEHELLLEESQKRNEYDDDLDEDFDLEQFR